MLHAIFFGFAIALAVLGTSIARFWFAQRDAATGPVDRISCPRFLPVIAIAVGLFFVVGSGLGFLRDFRPHWLVIFLPGVAVVLAFLPLLIRSEVRLVGGALSGPGKTIGPFILFNRQSIKITDIVAVGTSKGGYSYYESRDGRRVYFSNGYPGVRAFDEAVRSARSAAP